jgi:hypothetical protein
MGWASRSVLDMEVVDSCILMRVASIYPSALCSTGLTGKGHPWPNAPMTVRRSFKLTKEL